MLILLWYYYHMVRISFSKLSFKEFSNCPLERLDEEISRYAIRMKLYGNPLTPGDGAAYLKQLDRLTVLKNISQLRKGKMAHDDFMHKVILVESEQPMSPPSS
ncbi:hypothetical protein ACS5PU_20110 [Pedobacter sp. GSP4]|uniref:hypothetical protein n=1 Tax=Pedobacter sp. GSP4 TaxID=3453716 RepID=UPI003EE9D3D5